MRAVETKHLTDLGWLAIGIDLLTGTNTVSLYVPIVDFPVLDVNTDETVGHFTYDYETEKFVFRPSRLEP